MQEYLHKTRLSEKMDTLGFHLLALLLSLGFFLLLWWKLAEFLLLTPALTAAVCVVLPLEVSQLMLVSQ